MSEGGINDISRLRRVAGAITAEFGFSGKGEWFGALILFFSREEV